MGNSNSSNGNMENPMDKFDNFDNVIDFILHHLLGVVLLILPSAV
jgi:hypothetical protein